MNNNAKKWIEALRSGKYKQTTGQLKRVTKTRTGYCCLGVACELYRQETGEGVWFDEQHRPMFQIDSKNASASVLPLKVRDWLGLKTTFGTYADTQLTARNDARASFKTIANIIEREPEGLFKKAK